VAGLGPKRLRLMPAPYDIPMVARLNMGAKTAPLHVCGIFASGLLGHRAGESILIEAWSTWCYRIPFGRIWPDGSGLGPCWRDHLNRSAKAACHIIVCALMHWIGEDLL
jgi:hypothetical protein